jgi:hypothetical protein
VARRIGAFAIAVTLAAAGCGGTATRGGQDVRSRPPVGALVDSWGWIGITRGHAELWYRGARWTSAGVFHRPPEWITGAEVRSTRIAFSVEGRGLYVARLPGPERAVPGAMDETPLTWSRQGTLLGLDRAGHLVVRGPEGGLLTQLRIRRRLVAVEPASGSVFYVTPSDELVRTDGLRATRLGDVSHLAADPRGIESLEDGSTALFGRRRIAIVGSAGQLTASAPIRRRALLTQDVSAAPDGRGYAYVLTTRRRNGGTDTVELLLPGAHVARTVATIPVSLKGCGWGSTVTWHGSWIRYRNRDGRHLAVDTRPRTA